MITIRNTNELYGRPACNTAKTLGLAVEAMQADIRACGAELADVIVTDADYEIVAASCGDCGASAEGEYMVSIEHISDLDRLDSIEYISDLDHWVCPQCADRWTNCYRCNANIRITDAVAVDADPRGVLCRCCADCK